MTVQVIMEVSIKEGRYDDFCRFMTEILPGSRSHKGCVSIDFVRNQDDPADVVVMEKWDSRQEYEAYVAWRTESGVLNQGAEMFATQPKIRFLDPMGL